MTEKPTYAGHTQRAILATIGSVPAGQIEAARSDWQATASRARAVAALIEQRLATLTGPEGWTGRGAEAYAKAVRTDLIDKLEAYADQAERNTEEYARLHTSVTTSMSTAQANDIPWDRTAAWRVEARGGAYRLLDGFSTHLRELPKASWEKLLATHPPATPPEIFPRTGTSVSVDVHRFDRLMEALAMNTSAHAAVRASAEATNAQLGAFAPNPEVRRDSAHAPLPTDQDPQAPQRTAESPAAASAPASHPGGAAAGDALRDPAKITAAGTQAAAAAPPVTSVAAVSNLGVAPVASAPAPAPAVIPGAFAGQPVGVPLGGPPGNSPRPTSTISARGQAGSTAALRPGSVHVGGARAAGAGAGTPASASVTPGPHGTAVVNPGSVGPIAGPEGLTTGASMAGMPMIAPRAGQRDDERTAEHSTWLEEDSDVWLHPIREHAGNL